MNSKGVAYLAHKSQYYGLLCILEFPLSLSQSQLEKKNCTVMLLAGLVNKIRR